MNYTFLMVSIALLTYSSCQPSNDLERTWVTSYIDLLEKDTITRHYGTKDLLRFDSDSAYYSGVGFSMHDKPNSSLQVPSVAYAYTIEEDSLRIYDDKNDNKYSYELYQDSFIFYNDNGNILAKVVYKPLERYGAVSQTDQFLKLITSSTFTIEDTLLVEYQEGGKLWINDLESAWISHKYWRIDTYDEELFLIKDGPWGSLEQVKTVRENGFTTVLYHDKKEEVNYNKTISQRSYTAEDLKGTWIIGANLYNLKKKNIPDSSFSSPPPPPMPPPPPLPAGITEEDMLEQFVFSSNTITYTSIPYRSETSWTFNNTKSAILFSKEYSWNGGEHWNIIELTEDYMIIQRKKKRQGGYNPYSFAKSEFVTFYKKR